MKKEKHNYHDSRIIKMCAHCIYFSLSFTPNEENTEKLECTFFDEEITSFGVCDKFSLDG